MNTESNIRRPPDAWNLTRRAFLALCLVGCSQLTRRSLTKEPAEQNWAMISDTHIGASRGLTVRGSRMADNLERVIAEAVAAGPDHVLVNGDLAFASGEKDDYATFHDLISPLTSRGIPLHVTPGNHDHRDRLVESFAAAATPTMLPDASVPGKLVCSRIIGGVHWILLDSLERVGSLPGRLGSEQRQWLARTIDSAPAPAIVCLHHNPQRWITGLQDADELLDVILARRRVKAVIFGHTHAFQLRQTEGLHFVSLPACGYCVLVNPNSSLGWVWAGVRQDGMRLELRGLTARRLDHDAAFNLTWRSDA